MVRRLPPYPARVDFVTPLAPEICLRTLRRQARKTTCPPLVLTQHGPQVQIVALGWCERRKRTGGLWRFRFEGELVATQAGTRLHGHLAFNQRLNTALLSMGGCSGMFSAVGVTFAAYRPAEGTFLALLSLLFLGLYVIFFASYHRTIQREGAALLDDLYRWLVLPETA